MQPGSAYILVGAAQGCTKSCERRCVGHNRCNCCWTHGILAASNVVRQSMTLRVLADDEDSSSSSSSDDENAGGGGSAGGEGATRSRVAVGADTDADGTQTAGGDDA